MSRKDTEQSCRDSLSPRLAGVTTLIVDYLFDSHPMMTNAACIAIGEMGR